MEVQSCGSSFVCHFCVVTVVRFFDCSKDKLCCYCPVPCLLLIVSLWPVLLFICTFHLHIQPFFFFFISISIAVPFSVPLLCWLLCPHALYRPRLAGSFLIFSPRHSLCRVLSRWSALFLEIALLLGFCSVILMGNIVFSNKYGCQIHSTCVKVFAGVFSEGATVTVLTHLVP